MSETTEEEILAALNESSDQIEFEEPLDSTDSPLNQPIVENQTEYQGTSKVKKLKKPVDKGEYIPPEDDPHAGLNDTEKEAPEIDDVPEQEIGSEDFNEYDEEAHSREEFEIPKGHANQAADTILGITDNILSVGGGFFVKIKKHKDFFEFEEIIQIIEDQNDKNVTRLKLDEEDKILLRPLIITMLQRRAKKLTPEEQMMGAVLSIMMKKGQVVMEIKAENEILMDRILDAIQAERAKEKKEAESVQDEVVNDAPPTQEAEKETVESVEVIDEEIPNSVLEVADETETVITPEN